MQASVLSQKPSDQSKGKALTNSLLFLQETDNPDLRDRAYIYWRLLSTDPEAAKEVVLAEKPVISNSAYTIEPPLVDVLLKNIATIASVYHRPPEVSNTFCF